MRRNPYIDDECICEDSDPEISSSDESPFEFVPPTQKKRKSPSQFEPLAKHWRFTTNNPIDSDYPCLASCPLIERCIFQLEVGGNLHTPHLEGNLLSFHYHLLIQDMWSFLKDYAYLQSRSSLASSVLTLKLEKGQ